ncbi:MAG: prepilin-type cleavage/methylation domain-containing protein [Comamonadaceae bacterium]|nr:prepilin-type cleavage/methylation domain-containing protein [Comamonadaceae bacterium]
MEDEAILSGQGQPKPVPQNAVIFSRHLIAHKQVKTPNTHHQGFSLIELMVVMAIIAILALMVVPSLAGKYIRENIVEAMPLANIAKGPVAAAWATTQTLPEDNESAGLPAADKIVNNVVKSVTLEEGAIHIVFGNRANGALQGKTLTLRPAVVEDEPMVPVAWVCGHAKAPEKMTAMGTDKTDIATAHLPVNCR